MVGILLINYQEYNNKDRLPLVLKEARQVGKTWILKQFGKEYFDEVLYINFYVQYGILKGILIH